MWVVCLPFLSLGCCMLYSASVHFAAAACTAFVSKGVGVVVPLVVAVSFDVGEEDGSVGNGVGVEELDRTSKLNVGADRPQILSNHGCIC